VSAWRCSASASGWSADVVGAVQTVFLVAAPLAALALIVVLWLPEIALQGRSQAPAKPAAGQSAANPRPVHAAR
jgi:hypothetical protein